MKKEINQALADLSRLDFILNENIVPPSQALEELNSLLIDLMVAIDIWDIKENLRNGNTYFLRDVLVGNGLIPYLKLKNSSPGAIIHEFNNRNMTDDAKEFINTVNRIYEDETNNVVDLKIKQFLTLVDAVAKEYLP